MIWLEQSHRLEGDPRPEARGQVPPSALRRHGDDICVFLPCLPSLFPMILLVCPSFSCPPAQSGLGFRGWLGRLSRQAEMKYSLTPSQDTPLDGCVAP